LHFGLIIDLLESFIRIVCQENDEYFLLADNSTVRMAAMNGVKRDMATVSLSDPELPHPVLYNFMYIQWEANEVRNDCKVYCTVIAGSYLLVKCIIRSV
jgi:hypothetical protein